MGLKASAFSEKKRPFSHPRLGILTLYRAKGLFFWLTDCPKGCLWLRYGRNLPGGRRGFLYRWGSAARPAPRSFRSRPCSRQAGGACRNPRASSRRQRAAPGSQSRRPCFRCTIACGRQEGKERLRDTVKYKAFFDNEK